MTPLAFSLLGILADGQFHSGETVAGTLAVSRASICNAAKALEAAGIELYRVKGRGYRLAREFEWLDSERIESRLNDQASRFTFEIHHELDSTSSWLLAHPEAPSGTVVACELQRAGRGRLGRPWHSGLGGALTFSLKWRFSGGASSLSGLSLAVGLAAARALDAFCPGIALKWPNDLLWQFKKVAGILIEVQGDMLGPTVAVIGIGINTRLSPDTRDEIDQATTDLLEITGKPVSRNALLAAVLRELADVLDEFEKNGMSRLRAEWTARHAYQSKPVSLRAANGERIEGVAMGIAETGELLLETGKGRIAYSSGEISMRGAA